MSLDGIVPALQRRKIWILLLIFLAALVVRISVVFYLDNFDTITGYENEEIAVNMIDGHGYSMGHFGPRQPSAFMYPLYSFFLYFHFLLFGHDFMPVELTQALIGSLAAVLLFPLGARLFRDDRVGWLAAIGGAFYPIYVYWVARGQALIIEICLLEMLVLAWLWAMEVRRFSSYALCGVVMGLAGLSKTLYLAFFPLFIVWFRLARGASLKELARAAVISGVFSLLVICPWTARNYVVMKKFIPVTLNNGYNLWIGNNPQATGGMFTKNYRGMWETVPEEMLVKLETMTEVEKDALFQQEAVEHIRDNPAAFIRLVPNKLLFLWWFSPYMATDFPGFREIVYLLLLIPALAGMALSYGRIRELSIFYMIYLEMSVIYSIYFAMARFRYLVEFSFIVFAAYAFIWTFDAIIQKRNTS